MVVRFKLMYETVPPDIIAKKTVGKVSLTMGVDLLEHMSD